MTTHQHLSCIDFYMSTLSERVKDSMNAMDLSQSALAKLVGVSQPTINDLLHGRIEKPRFILPLANALKTTPEWLLYGEGKKTAELPQKYDNANFRKLLALCYEVWATEKHTSRISSETVLKIAETVYDHIKDLPEQAQEASIRSAFSVNSIKKDQ